LLINCALYLCEICDYKTCSAVIQSGRLACSDEESLNYATLCSIEGCTAYELNDLEKCRKNFETFFRIQEKLLSNDDIEVRNIPSSLSTGSTPFSLLIQRSTSFHHMGVLECASDNLEAALEHFLRAAAIRIKSGDSASNLLANTYLRMSRVHFNKQEYKTAFELLQKAEFLYLRVSDGEAPFMAQ